MGKTKKHADDGTIVSSAGILRGQRIFIEVSKIGEVNNADKAVFSLGYKGKIIAKPDHPLGLVLWLLDEIVPMVRYSSDEALKADLAMLAKYIDNLGPRTETPDGSPA